MEAPKKLFIRPEMIKVEMIPGGELPNVGIQYIRKDLLLEWAKEQMEKDLSFLDDFERGWREGKNDLLDDLIDKLSTL